MLFIIWLLALFLQAHNRPWVLWENDTLESECMNQSGHTLYWLETHAI